jgi:hypothetical protein
VTVLEHVDPAFHNVAVLVDDRVERWWALALRASLTPVRLVHLDLLDVGLSPACRSSHRVSPRSTSRLPVLAASRQASSASASRPRCAGVGADPAATAAHAAASRVAPWPGWGQPGHGGRAGGDRAAGAERADVGRAAGTDRQTGWPAGRAAAHPAGASRSTGGIACTTCAWRRACCWSSPGAEQGRWIVGAFFRRFDTVPGPRGAQEQTMISGRAHRSADADPVPRPGASAARPARAPAPVAEAIASTRRPQDDRRRQRAYGNR